MSEFEEYLRLKGAREFEIASLSSDEERALAALAEAERRGAERPVPYALKIFEDPSWTATPKRKPLRTNLAVDRQCSHCDGLRFVLVTDDPGLYGETWAPCRECNTDAFTAFYRVDGSRFESTPR